MTSDFPKIRNMLRILRSYSAGAYAFSNPQYVVNLPSARSFERCSKTGTCARFAKPLQYRPVLQISQV